MSKRILFVDDSETIRKFISFGLRMRGFQLFLASDGQEALEKLAQNEVELIITDLNMPNMDGFELITNLRQDSVYKHIPIIVLTTESQQEERIRAINSGANSYLIKPFKIDVIVQEIENLLATIIK